MKISRFLLVLAFVGMMLASAGTADAVCALYGKIVEIVMPAGGGNAVVYLATENATPVVYYVFTISNALHAQIDTLTAAMAANYTVYIYGNAASCPTTGTVRAAGAIVNQIYVYRNL